MAEKLEIEIIEDGDGGTRSLSPHDFPNIREFNRALAQLKAEARVRDFEETQALKERKKTLNEQKVQLNEQKQIKTAEIQQTKLTVQAMKARRQLEVAASQDQRAREAEVNKQNRQREMMLRHVLGAINPNSTFQYRMSSLYGLINTARTINPEDAGMGQPAEQAAIGKVDNILSLLSGGLRSLFGQTSLFSNLPQVKKSLQEQVGTVISKTVSPSKQQIESVSKSVAESNQEEYQPWWMTYRTPAEKEKKAQLSRYSPEVLLKSKGSAPQKNEMGLSDLYSSQRGDFRHRLLVQSLGIKPPPQALPNLIATPAGIGGGGVPPTAVGASPAGVPPGGGGILGALFNTTIGRLGLLGLATYGVKKAFDMLYASAKALDARFSKVIEDIRPFSASLIVSGAMSDLRMMQFNRERAKMFGPQLANYEQSQTSLKIAFEKLIDTVTMPLTGLMTSINSELANTMQMLTLGIDLLKIIAGQMPSNDVGANLAKAAKFASEFFTFMLSGSLFIPGAKSPSFDGQKLDVGDLANQLSQFLNMPLPGGLPPDQFSFDMGP